MSVVPAAELAATAAVRQMMHYRDNDALLMFDDKYRPDELESTKAKLAVALASPAIRTPQSYTVDFGGFLSSRNTQYQYADPPLSTQVNTLPKTPADNLLYSGHPMHTGGVWWESSQLTDISYTNKLEALGMTHRNWTSDVLNPMRAINKRALESRTRLGILLRSTSAASWTLKITQGSNRCQVWASNNIGLGAEENDTSTYCDYALCIFLIPFRMVSCIATTPIFLLLTIFTAVISSLFDLVSCYSCRIDTAAKLAAITSVLNENSDLDENRLAEKMHADLQQLADSLNTKYGTTVMFEAIMTAEFVAGEYYNKYVPAHTLVKHHLAAFAPQP